MVSTTKTSDKANAFMTLYKFRLTTEWLVLFFGVPLVVALGWLPFTGRWVKLILLLSATFICLLYLLWDKNFGKKRLGGLTKLKLIWKGLLLRSLLCAALLLILGFLFYPEHLFGLLKYRFNIWLMVFILYPILSAWPQELIYRSFMFQRYKTIFGENYGMVAASSVAFAFLHIIYLNWLAITLTLIAGFIFSINYKKTGVLATVALEHAIYGNLLFTIGFGMFFFRAM